MLAIPLEPNQRAGQPIREPARPAAPSDPVDRPPPRAKEARRGPPGAAHSPSMSTRSRLLKVVTPFGRKTMACR
jgi:hypothetical protein